jgi:hypothetical protein
MADRASAAPSTIQNFTTCTSHQTITKSIPSRLQIATDNSKSCRLRTRLATVACIPRIPHSSAIRRTLTWLRLGARCARASPYAGIGGLRHKWTFEGVDRRGRNWQAKPGIHRVANAVQLAPRSPAHGEPPCGRISATARCGREWVTNYSAPAAGTRRLAALKPRVIQFPRIAAFIITTTIITTTGGSSKGPASGRN